MAKMAIEWYEKCLKNASAYEENMREELARYVESQSKRINETAKDNNFREFQIKVAKQKGLDSFSDHFQKKAWEKRQKED